MVIGGCDRFGFVCHRWPRALKTVKQTNWYEFAFRFRWLLVWSRIWSAHIFPFFFWILKREWLQSFLFYLTFDSFLFSSFFFFKLAVAFIFHWRNFSAKEWKWYLWNWYLRYAFTECDSSDERARDQAHTSWTDKSASRVIRSHIFSCKIKISTSSGYRCSNF